MPSPPAADTTLAAGVDLGSSGLRLALINGLGQPVAARQLPYPRPFEDPRGWLEGLEGLFSALPAPWLRRVAAISLDGTSGTLLLCGTDGTPAGAALAYSLACREQLEAVAALVPAESPAASASGSLARALRLLGQLNKDPSPVLVRHQADWVMGWLLRDWRWGEEGNNLRLGWDLLERRWTGSIASQPWSSALPEVVASGQALGRIHPAAATILGLSPSCVVVAGSTDSNAAVLAAEPAPEEGLAVLGTTLVLKQFVEAPIQAAGVSCHRLDGRWLIGGASNAGGGVLRRFFSDDELRRLSRQIDPSRPSGLALRPLPGPGERFPIDDPELEPILGPRPVSDALFLQALLEGLAAIEARGWQRLRQLGAPGIRGVLSVGGGARNPQWRHLRQQAIGLPVRNRPGRSPALGAARLALRGLARDGLEPRMGRH